MRKPDARTPTYDLDAVTRRTLAHTPRSSVYAIQIPRAPQVPCEFDLDAEWDVLGGEGGAFEGQSTDASVAQALPQAPPECPGTDSPSKSQAK